MSIAGVLTGIAGDIAQEAKARGAQLKTELEQIEARKAEIEAKLNAIRGLPERLFHYGRHLGADFQCPLCWIEHEKSSRMTPTPDDSFRCDACNSTFKVY